MYVRVWHVAYALLTAHSCCGCAQTEAQPVAVSDLGSQTKLTLRTCGVVESTTMESVFRTWTNPAGKVLQTTSIDYAFRKGDGSSAGTGDWWLRANRFPVSSYQVDYVLTSNGVDYGDLVARAEIPAELINPKNKTLLKGGYTGSLCIARPDGGEGFAPKWNLEFYTSDRAVRRAVIGALVFKAIRDNRRSPTTGEYVDNEWYAQKRG